MRSGFDEVPGCMGIGRKDKHYCRFSGTSYYEYEKIGTCKTGQDKWQGPAPFANKSNLAISFFAFGDTPYDDACSECNTCIGIDGNKEDSCTRFDCILKSISMSELPVNTPYTYEGPDYECLKQGIIPYLNAYAGDEAAFVAHVGDIMSECLSYDSIFYARFHIDLFSSIPTIPIQREILQVATGVATSIPLRPEEIYSATPPTS